MIVACPYCGRNIPDCLVDGLASCTHCSRIFDSSIKNRLMSASWLLKKNRYHGVEQLISDTKLPEYEAILVYSFVSDNCYSIEEFRKVLDKLNITEKVDVKI